MSKRPSSPGPVGESNTRAAHDLPEGPAQRQRTVEDASKQTVNRVNAADPDDDMGEFEDQFEDEFEDEDATHTHQADDDDGDDDDDDDGDEGMEVDGVKVSSKITRVDDEDGDEAQAQQPESQVYIPGVNTLQDGQTLEVDQSAYEMLHKLNVTWPCLSFDHLRDHLGNDRQSFPHTSYFVAGTQADVPKNNEVMVMKASSLHKTQNDDSEYHNSFPSLTSPRACVVAMMLEAFGCMSTRTTLGSLGSLDADNFSLPKSFTTEPHTHARIRSFSSSSFLLAPRLTAIFPLCVFLLQTTLTIKMTMMTTVLMMMPFLSTAPSLLSAASTVSAPRPSEHPALTPRCAWTPTLLPYGTRRARSRSLTSDRSSTHSTDPDLPTTNARSTRPCTQLRRTEA